MIRGKKVMRPIRKLKIQDKADMNEDLIKDFIDENEELTLLMAVNCIVTLAEDSELSSSFFEKADRFITYFSERQGITKIQAVLLALFIESSAAGNKSDFSDVANYLNCNIVSNRGLELVVGWGAAYMFPLINEVLNGTYKDANGKQTPYGMKYDLW